MSPVMPPGARKRAACALAFVSFALVAAGPRSPRARAGEPGERDECVESAEHGQQLRDDGKYRLAREAFARCARDSCPAMVRRDCALWQLDLEQRSATVVINARDDRGNDLVEVKVSVDGAELTPRLDGKPIPVDPGEHTFHCEAADFPPIDKHVVINASEKNRVLSFQFERPTAAVAPSPVPPSAAPVEERSGAVPPLFWVFAGTAAAAFASEAYFGLSGISQRGTDLGAGGCAPHCSSAEKSSIQTKFLIADVSLGLGLVSSGLAAYFWLRPRERAVLPAASLDFAPRPGGGIATLGHRF